MSSISPNRPGATSFKCSCNEVTSLVTFGLSYVFQYRHSCLAQKQSKCTVFISEHLAIYWIWCKISICFIESVSCVHLTSTIFFINLLGHFKRNHSLETKATWFQNKSVYWTDSLFWKAWLSECVALVTLKCQISRHNTHKVSCFWVKSPWTTVSVILRLKLQMPRCTFCHFQSNSDAWIWICADTEYQLFN